MLISAFLITALITGYCIHLFQVNRRLQATDIKDRAIRQNFPISTHWVDSNYTANPDTLESQTIQSENEASERAETEALIKQKEAEIKAARKRFNKLKSRKKN